MPRFSANLSLLYADLPFLERFHAAKADGFEVVEYQFPYESMTGSKLHAIKAVMTELNLKMDLHNLPVAIGQEVTVALLAIPLEVKNSRLHY